MNCAICGKDNQAGTRFCVHCGAALTAPAGGSRQSTIETAGAILGPKPAAPMTVPPSSSIPAPAAQAASGATPAYIPRPTSPPPPPPETTFTPAEIEPGPAVPAYNANPKRAGWVLIAIAVAGAVAIGGYFGYKVVGGKRGANDTLTRIETTQQAAPTPPVQSSRPPPAAAIADAPKSAPETSPPATQETRVPAPVESPQPTPVAPPKAEHKAPRATASGQSATRQPVAPPVAAPPPAVSAPQAPVRTAQPANVAPAAPVPDRWAQFAEDLHHCERETFLSRVVCDQRVRLRYCDGYWGKVPQCPGGVANPDRGQ